ncbi:hypothetical protein HYDPIDRAFT_116594 [Hydnomerulius pinastri MD-312]|uniref:Lysosomal dipeptide transporter MFSD1 n=1 Tax=Hydnomerulius pinastri MD-312 TaxID=994086 RepID=A0A0C9WB55_9AGAM|nr:hypothetical protein HYDPIDRAFT_116594 [Hydnomerulius pinastri MD-312]
MATSRTSMELLFLSSPGRSLKPTMVPGNLAGSHSETMSLSPTESKASPSTSDEKSVQDESVHQWPTLTTQKPKLPVKWQIAMIVLTCMCTFGNHWSNGLIISMKTTIEKNLKINNSEFATLVAVTNLINTLLCVAGGFVIDRFGGPLLSVYLAAFHFAGALVEAGATTNHLNSYPVLVAGKVLAAIGDGSLDNAQHKIFATYFAPGHGFAFSIGVIWSMANLAQFTGQSTANIIAKNLHSYSWTLWISSVVSLISLLCAIGVLVLDKYLRANYDVMDYSKRFDKRGVHSGTVKTGTFHWHAVFQMPLTFWLVVLFAIFENAGVQSFVSISTQFAQQRLKQGAVIGGWVSSFYLLLPVGLTPFEGIFIDGHGHRVTFLFLSGLLFLVSMLLLRLSETVPAFVCAYVFYALSQSLTPAPQVEIVRSIIPDPHYYATAFAIKKSIVQASIVIIVTAAGKIQDMTPGASLANAVTVWVVYAFVSVLASGALLVACYTEWGKRYLPAARLSQVRPRELEEEVQRMWDLQLRHHNGNTDHLDVDRANAGGEELTVKHKEIVLKTPILGKTSSHSRRVAVGAGFGVILIGWIIFGLGVDWGVHGNVVAGTVGE